MAIKYWDYLKLKNGDKAAFIPPAPNGDKLGGVSAAEKSTWSGKQDVITDITTIRSGAALGATAVQPETGKGLFSGSYTDLTDKPSIPTKTSDLTNDSGFLTEHQDISGKVDKVDGKGLSTNDYDNTEKQKNADNATAITSLNQAIADKQDKLIAGTNITIAADGKTISATGGGGSVDYFTVQNGKVCAVYEGSV